MGEGEFQVELKEREPGPTGARRGRLPDPAQPRHAVRAGRRHGVGRRALARCACARRRRRRRDARLRRDRRRHRRRHRASRGRDAEPARRAGPGVTITHLPQIANVADAALPRREGARRPDADGDRGALGRRAPHGARAHARRRGVPDGDRVRAASNDRGRRHRPARPADEGSRQEAAARRSRDHRPRRSRPRLGRGARRLRRAGRRQRLAVELRPLPEPGPARAGARGRLPRRRDPGADLFDAGRRRRDGDRAGRRPVAQRHAARRGRRAHRALARAGARRPAEPRHRGARGVRRQHAAPPPRRGQAPRRRHRLSAADDEVPRSPRRRRRARAWVQERPEDRAARTSATSSRCSLPSTVARTRCSRSASSRTSSSATSTRSPMPR